MSSSGGEGGLWFATSGGIELDAPSAACSVRIVPFDIAGVPSLAAPRLTSSPVAGVTVEFS